MLTYETAMARLETLAREMENGDIVEENTSEEFFSNPQKERTREFIYKSQTWASKNEHDGSGI